MGRKGRNNLQDEVNIILQHRYVQQTFRLTDFETTLTIFIANRLTSFYMN